MARIKIEGLDKLQKKLKDNVTLDDVKRVVKTNGGQLRVKMKRNAEFKKGYQTGTTKRSIDLTITDAGFTAEVKPTTEYSPYLEYGTRKMEAQPFVWPAFKEQEEKFERDKQRLVR